MMNKCIVKRTNSLYAVLSTLTSAKKLEKDLHTHEFLGFKVFAFGFNCHGSLQSALEIQKGSISLSECSALHRY